MLMNYNKQINLRWALFVTYTIIQSIMRSEMCSLHLTHPSGAVGSRHCSAWGFSALLKGLTSVVDTSCQSRDSNPQPWVTSGFKSNALTIRPRLPYLPTAENYAFSLTHCDTFSLTEISGGEFCFRRNQTHGNVFQECDSALETSFLTSVLWMWDIGALITGGKVLCVIKSSDHCYTILSVILFIGSWHQICNIVWTVR